MDDHHSLKFIGLALTRACEFCMFSDDAPEYMSSVVVCNIFVDSLEKLENQWPWTSDHCIIEF